MRTKNANKDTGTDKGADLGSLDMPAPLPVLPQRYLSIEIPEHKVAPRLRYLATRRLRVIERDLALPPVTVRWYVHGGDLYDTNDTGDEIDVLSAVTIICRWWGESFENCLAHHVRYDGDDTEKMLGYALQVMPDTIWMRAEPWEYAPSAAKRGSDGASPSFTVGDVVTHECRHLWQYRHFTQKQLRDKALLEGDADSYTSLTAMVRERWTLPGRLVWAEYQGSAEAAMDDAARAAMAESGVAS